MAASTRTAYSARIRPPSWIRGAKPQTVSCEVTPDILDAPDTEFVIDADDPMVGDDMQEDMFERIVHTLGRADSDIPDRLRHDLLLLFRNRTVDRYQSDLFQPEPAEYCCGRSTSASQSSTIGCQ